METKKFNVISYDNKTHEFTDYDVIPFFVDKYKEIKRGKPITFDDFGEFILSNSFRQFNGRHEYEFELISNESYNPRIKTIDIDWQIRNNLDLVIEMVMEQVKNK